MSFDKKHLLKHGVKKNDIIKEEVVTTSINSLIKKYNLDLIDLIFIDAEGYDADIVEDFFKNFFKKTCYYF